MTIKAPIYHVTFKSNVASIAKKGLVTHRKRIWKNMFGQFIGQPDKIYFITDFHEAVRFAAKLEWFSKKTVVILTINSVPRTYQKDDHIENMFDTWFKTSEHFAVGTIVKVDDLTIDMQKHLIRNDRQKFSTLL